MTSKSRTSRSRPSEDAVYRRKAREFAGSMDMAILEKEWNTAAVLGVHAAISGADALTSKLLGLHSTGQSHGGAVNLVAGLKVEGAPAKSDQLLEILSMKHAAAYEGREVSESDALITAKQVRRFLAWVEAGMATNR
jgi:hypothetical protein